MSPWHLNNNPNANTKPARPTALTNLVPTFPVFPLIFNHKARYYIYQDLLHLENGARGHKIVTLEI